LGWDFFACVLLICEEFAGYEKPYRGKGNEIACSWQLSIRAKIQGQVAENKSRKKRKKITWCFSKRAGTLWAKKVSVTMSALAGSEERNHPCVEPTLQSKDF